MFKIGDIVEPKEPSKDVFFKYLLGYPHDYYKVISVGIDTITILPINDGFSGVDFYVDSNNWQLDRVYLRRLKIEKICLKLEKK